MKLVGDNIEKLIPYTPGKPVDILENELGLNNMAKLAANENPLGASPKALQALSDSLGEVGRYPDAGAYHLKQGISKKLGVDPEEIILGNGSNELLELIIRTFSLPNFHTVTSVSSFVIYKLAPLAHGVETREIPLKDGYKFDLESIVDSLTPESRFIFIANPNNPTGTYVNKNEFEKFLKEVPKSTFIIMDEAYFEYAVADDYPNALEYLKENPNLIVLRTFSKIYGLAGLRVGYGIASKELVQYMNRVRAPFNVNILAQKAALAALHDDTHVQKTVELCRNEMEWATKEFETMDIQVVASQANFLLVGLGERDAKDIHGKLIKKGVIVAPMAGYGLPKFHRVTLGTRDENLKMIEAYKTLCNC